MRARVIAAVLSLAALALTIAGFTAYTLERAMAERRVEGYLKRAVDEFRVLACGRSADCAPGIDPDTVAALCGAIVLRPVFVSVKNRHGTLEHEFSHYTRTEAVTAA